MNNKYLNNDKKFKRLILIEIYIEMLLKKQIYTDGEKGSYRIDFLSLSMAVL